jgi:hypothetical protein
MSMNSGIKMICRATALAFAGLWGVETAAQGLELSDAAGTAG